MNAPEVVRRYATTLLEAADESGNLDAVRQDVEGLISTLNQSEELVEFAGNRLLGSRFQRGVVEELFAGKVQALTLNFLLVVVERRRLNLLPAILDAFIQVAEERAGIVRAQVCSSVALSPEQEESLRQRLAVYTGKQVSLQTQVDESLRGGMIARVGDMVFDGSLDSQLKRLHRQLIGT